MSSVIISGDTSGSITLSAPAVAGTNTITLPAATGTVLTTATTGVCKAWITYNGSSQTILASYNVSSVTYRADGRYTINFTTAMADANYAVVGMVSNDNVATQYIGAVQDYTNAAPSASACSVMTGYATAAMVNSTQYRYTNYAYFAFFR